MTTIINTPPQTENTESSVLGLVLGVAVVIVLVVLFFIYGLPAIRNTTTTPQNGSVNVNVTTPPTNVIAPTPTN